MSALRGTIVAITAYDIDGNEIKDGSTMPVERVALLLDVNYADGDLRELLNRSIAHSPSFLTPRPAPNWCG